MQTGAPKLIGELGGDRIGSRNSAAAAASADDSSTSAKFIDLIDALTKNRSGDVKAAQSQSLDKMFRDATSVSSHGQVAIEALVRGRPERVQAPVAEKAELGIGKDVDAAAEAQAEQLFENTDYESADVVQENGAEVEEGAPEQLAVVEPENNAVAMLVAQQIAPEVVTQEILPPESVANVEQEVPLAAPQAVQTTTTTTTTTATATATATATTTATATATATSTEEEDDDDVAAEIDEVLLADAQAGSQNPVIAPTQKTVTEVDSVAPESAPKHLEPVGHNAATTVTSSNSDNLNFAEEATPDAGGAIEQAQVEDPLPSSDSMAAPSPTEIHPAIKALSDAPVTAILGSGLTPTAGPEAGGADLAKAAVVGARAAGIGGVAAAANPSAAGNGASNSGTGIPLQDGSSPHRTGQESSKTAKLPPSMRGRLLEKVQQALEEAVRSQDGKSVSFRLDPPQLGNVHVYLRAQGGALHARIGAENADVMSFLRERGGDLHESLRSVGLSFGEVNVSFGEMNFAGEGRHFSHHESQGAAETAMSGREGAAFSKVQTSAAELPAKVNGIVTDHWVA